MNPGDRVKFVVETAKALLEDRLDPIEALPAIQLQAEQLTPLLRSDRMDVTGNEAMDVATRLRLLAEQITDKASERPDPSTHDAHMAIAEAIGEMSQALR